MISKERLVNIFIKMLAHESPSFEERPMAEWLINYLQDRGFAVHMDLCADKIGGNCGNLVAHLKGNKSKEPISFAAHLDQIPPCKDIKPIITGNLIHTDGTTTLGGDDKAGIAAILEALEHVLEEKTDLPDIYLLFTVCEENGLLGAKNFDANLLPVKNIVIIDAAGPAGIIAYKAPAMKTIEITFKGKKAHAGIEPEKGNNAVKIAADAITNMHMGRIDWETTVNIGRIEGGQATNIVPDRVKVLAEIRSHSKPKLEAELAYMIKCCEESKVKNHSEFVFKSELNYPAFELSKDEYIYQLCIKAFKKAGIEPNPIITGGGSDANILSALGYNCAIISVGMDNVHTLEETVNIDDMYKTAKALAIMMEG